MIHVVAIVTAKPGQRGKPSSDITAPMSRQ